MGILLLPNRRVGSSKREQLLMRPGSWGRALYVLVSWVLPGGREEHL